jgi:hypothetical protein
MNYDTALQHYLGNKATQEEKDFLLDISLKALNQIAVVLKERHYEVNKNGNIQDSQV